MIIPEWIGIAPMRIELLESYSECLGHVAREKKYLRFTDSPPFESSRNFVQMILDARFPMWVAIIPGPTVVGWCDIAPGHFESEAHCASLGVGVHADYRGQGIGRVLIERALKQARTLRLERVSLDVYSSNTRAIDLYKSLEFEEEGIKRRARKVAGLYEDIILMVRHI